jgi:hypothetical protein
MCWVEVDLGQEFLFLFGQFDLRWFAYFFYDPSPSLSAEIYYAIAINDVSVSIPRPAHYSNGSN